MSDTVLTDETPYTDASPRPVLTAVVTAEPAKPRSSRPRSRPAPGTEGFSVVRALGMATIWLFTAFNCFILYWLLASSFKTPREIFDSPFGLPRDLFEVGRPFRNWATAWVTSGFGTAFVNTVIVVAVSCVLIIAIGSPAAYALSRFGARGSDVLTVFFIVGIGVPFQTVVIPLFVAMSKLGIADSLGGLMLVYVALSLPFTVFLLTGFFRSLPDELEEAAAVDGLGPARTFLIVMLPLARGGIITTVILNAIALWNETLIAVVLLREDSQFTMARALFTFYQTMQYNSDYGGLMAGVAIVVLPMFLLYLVLARRIIEGLTLGSGK
jgi:N-acetylglucosamine transport system permease protein